jgi:hypothetical protein
VTPEVHDPYSQYAPNKLQASVKNTPPLIGTPERVVSTLLWIVGLVFAIDWGASFLRGVSWPTIGSSLGVILGAALCVAGSRIRKAKPFARATGAVALCLAVAYPLLLCLAAFYPPLCLTFDYPPLRWGRPHLQLLPIEIATLAMIAISYKRQRGGVGA